MAHGKRPGWAWLLLFLAVCLLLPLVSTSAQAYSPAEWKETLESLSQKVALLESLSRQHLERSQTFRQLSESLQLELETSQTRITELLAQVESLENSAESTRQELQTSLNSVTSLQQRLNALLSDYQSLQQTRRRAMIRTGLIAVGAGIILGIAGDDVIDWLLRILRPPTDVPVDFRQWIASVAPHAAGQRSSLFRVSGFPASARVW